ncbi:MAG: alpha/beta hydrolase family protein [Candidatus Comchoanobacterales bacterium]
MSKIAIIVSNTKRCYWVEADQPLVIWYSEYEGQKGSISLPDQPWGTNIRGYGGKWLGVHHSYLWAITRQGAVWVYCDECWQCWVKPGCYQWGGLSWSTDSDYIMAVREMNDQEELVKITANDIQILHSDCEGYLDIIYHQHCWYWIGWQAPMMPWDETTLYQGYWNGDQWIHQKIKQGASLLQPQSTPLGLVVMSDEQGYYQPLLVEEEKVTELSSLPYDALPPLWQIGYQHWCYHQVLWVARSVEGQWVLYADDVVIQQPLVEINEILPWGSGCLLRGSSASGEDHIVTIQLNQEGHYIAEYWFNNDLVDNPYECYCIPHKGACSWLWRPKGKKSMPLIVWVHGGPTAQVTPSFDLKKQSWLDDGYAVLAINYTGSSGFGRDHRQALLGQWGAQDVDDVIDVTQQVVKLFNIDEKRLFIRGSSAGGLTALRVMQECSLFAGGILFYPVTDVSSLSDTHRFERYYGDRLLSSKCKTLHHKVNTPLLLFHGGKDDVVPLKYSQRLAAQLRLWNCNVTLMVFPNEGHGFRNEDTLVCSDRVAKRFCLLQCTEEL